VRGGRRSTSFKKGQSGNPGGKPKRFAELPPEAKAEAIQAIHDVKAAAKAESADAIKTLKTVMNNESAPSAARVGAAIAILDRGWGKPTQAVEANVNIFDQMTDDEQRIMLAALAALKAAEEEK
jgi:Family of unknown function (DUF5681)